MWSSVALRLRARLVRDSDIGSAAWVTWAFEDHSCPPDITKETKHLNHVSPVVMASFYRWRIEWTSGQTQCAMEAYNHGTNYWVSVGAARPMPETAWRRCPSHVSRLPPQVAGLVNHATR